MRSSWLPISLVIILTALLVLLASLQYTWLGQVSDSEKTRLEERVKDDTKRFADEFDREINLAFTAFQFSGDEWSSFKSRYDLWDSRAAFPSLIKDIYFTKLSDGKLSKYSPVDGKFSESEWSKSLLEIQSSFAGKSDFEHIYEKELALVIPIYESRKEFERLFVEAGKVRPENARRKLAFPKKSGFLIILLDVKKIESEILPKLRDKFFLSEGDESFEVLIKDRKEKIVFSTYDGKIDGRDAEARMFKLSAETVLILGDQLFKEGTTSENTETLVIGHSTVTTKKRKKVTEFESDTAKPGSESVDIDVRQNKRLRIVEGGRSHIDGIWVLYVRHKAGSLEKFIAQTRQRNLAISFGILALLAVSMGIILFSSQRARSLAQRQMDFVSSVSHEFRTPLSVIYSAGENLSDGVVAESAKIAKYGTLIKREGKKLSGMVEQILEFAGAEGGSRKYDFHNVEVSKIVHGALRECEWLIKEQGFEVETTIEDELPNIRADYAAIVLALQNLINNSLKYSNDNHSIRINASRNRNHVEISIQDFGLGIAKNELRNIFEPFFRAKNVVDRQISGNGLGLSLVKQIVDAHRGEVEVESNIGEGSRFVISLPIVIS